MKIDKNILPDVLDKTRNVKRLTNIKKNFQVPSVLQTLKITQDIKYTEEEQEEDSTNYESQIQEQYILNNFHCTNPEITREAKLHYQGKVFLHKVEVYRSIDSIESEDDIDYYARRDILKVRDILNPARKCLPYYRRSTKNTILVEGWLETQTDYDHEEYFPRVPGSILRRPKDLADKYRNLVLCGRISRWPTTEQFRLQEQRKNIYEYLSTNLPASETFVLNRSPSIHNKRWSVPPIIVPEGDLKYTVGNKRNSLIITSTELDSKYESHSKKLRSGETYFHYIKIE